MRALRERYSFTKKELAEELGLHVQTITYREMRAHINPEWVGDYVRALEAMTTRRLEKARRMVDEL